MKQNTYHSRNFRPRLPQKFPQLQFWGQTIYVHQIHTDETFVIHFSVLPRKGNCKETLNPTVGYLFRKRNNKGILAFNAKQKSTTEQQPVTFQLVFHFSKPFSFEKFYNLLNCRTRSNFHIHHCYCLKWERELKVTFPRRLTFFQKARAQERLLAERTINGKILDFSRSPTTFHWLKILTLRCKVTYHRRPSIKKIIKPGYTGKTLLIMISVPVRCHVIFQENSAF